MIRNDMNNQSKNSFFYLFPVLIFIFALLSCSRADIPRDNPNDPKSTSGNGTPILTQSIMVNSFTTILDTRLKGVGLTPAQSAIIIEGAKIEALTVIQTKLSRGVIDDVGKIAPNFVKGAMKKLIAAGLSDALKLTALKEITGSPVEALNGNMSTLNASQQSLLIYSITNAASSSLEYTGFTDSTNLSESLKRISAGATGSLGKAGLSPSVIAESIKALNNGAVGGLKDVKDKITALANNLAAAISKIAAGSIGALGEISGLSNEQIAYTSKLASQGATEGLADSGITDTTVKTIIIQEIATASVGALGDAGLPASYIANAAAGITDAIYHSLTIAGLFQSDALLNSIKSSAINGFNIIVVIGFDSASATTTINAYTGTYTDPYATSMTKFSVGGSVSGLSGTLVLQNNGADNLSLTASGNFTFAISVNDQATYTVTILNQPFNQTCTITTGTASGTISGTNITDVAISCSSNLFTIGGSVTGLTGSLMLQNNGTNDLTMNADGAFTFTVGIANSAGYNVTVGTQPSGQTCNIVNATGTVNSANVSNVSVSCSTTAQNNCVVDTAVLPCTVF